MQISFSDKDRQAAEEFAPEGAEFAFKADELPDSFIAVDPESGERTRYVRDDSFVDE